MSRSKKHTINLYVSTVFNGKASVAGWVRKNGEPDKLPSGTRRLKKIGRKKSDLVAKVLSVSAALRDIPNNSQIKLHLTDQNLAEIINSEKISRLLRMAKASDVKFLAEAAHGLLDEIARHRSVSAVAVDARKSADAESILLLNKAYQIASDVKENVQGRSEKLRKGSRRRYDRDAIAESLDAA